MPRTRPACPLEFRHQMVELVRLGRPATELARDFECCAETIRRWVRQADLDEGRPRPIRNSNFLQADWNEITWRRGAHNRLGFAL